MLYMELTCLIISKILFIELSLLLHSLSIKLYSFTPNNSLYSCPSLLSMCFIIILQVLESLYLPLFFNEILINISHNLFI